MFCGNSTLQHQKHLMGEHVCVNVMEMQVWCFRFSDPLVLWCEPNLWTAFNEAVSLWPVRCACFTPAHKHTGPTCRASGINVERSLSALVHLYEKQLRKYSTTHLCPVHKKSKAYKNAMECYYEQEENSDIHLRVFILLILYIWPSKTWKYRYASEVQPCQFQGLPGLGKFGQMIPQSIEEQKQLDPPLWATIHTGLEKRNL